MWAVNMSLSALTEVTDLEYAPDETREKLSDEEVLRIYCTAW